MKRWKEQNKLPKPDLVIGDREFWKKTTIDEHDRKMTAESANSAPARRYNFVTGTVTTD